MGTIINSVQDANCLGDQFSKFASNASSNMTAGAKTCPAIAQCVDFKEGIAQGDFSKTALNGGVLALALLPIAEVAHAGQKVAAASLSQTAIVCQVAMVGAATQLLSQSPALSEESQCKDASVLIDFGLRGGGEYGEHHYHHHPYQEELACEACAERESRGYGTPFPIKQRPLLIGATGGTASGKTSVCELIGAQFQDQCVIITLDSFYRGLEGEDLRMARDSLYDFDSPAALDLDLAYEKIKQLMNYEDVDLPIYDFSTHSRKKNQFEHVKSKPLVIFEGIMALHDKRFRDLMDLKIFVSTDDDIRLARRIQRDTKERGRTVESVIAQYNRFVKPSFDKYIKPTQQFADFVVPRGRSNVVAIDFIVCALKQKLQLEQFALANRTIQQSQNLKFKKGCRKCQETQSEQEEKSADKSD